ncbi:hypothetical protein EI42_01544 [Thermosporothrix hazakensis]|jgi:hypothetical protein|uniref:Type II/IV secretion system protein n=1 Tax=Thermosporothrix hazakensis TaxID=644383 RepID=A0A326U9U7_THEHA|nr:hypothetical protein [Thermosporothrix hazakensis]PZW32996.1 hypothetical protein EI42_01544 [Thermosporothrix hazakensis]GCE49028.1 hypothetical protein KTH_38970 [Thermosporothrix hazakensis]
MFDPRDPYERYYWHYESRRPLSIAQIIALGSVDAWTAALAWVLLEHGSSLTVAGPTDPQPGVGKTTTLNALLQFLPEGTALAYMAGMYETFAFTRLPEVDPATTYALCNEVSDHLPIYMWGRAARRYLTLPAKGFHIATSVHADTIHDVIQMYHRTLRLTPEDVRRLGLVINIGLVGRGYPPRRRWLTMHFLQPITDVSDPEAIVPVSLSSWNMVDDTFIHAEPAVLERVAEWIEVPAKQFQTMLERRTAWLEKLAQDLNVGPQDMFEAVEEFRLLQEQ